MLNMAHQAMPHIECIYQSCPLSSASQLTHAVVKNWTGITNVTSYESCGSSNARSVIFTNDLVQKLMVVKHLIKLFNHDYPHQIWKYIYSLPIYWKPFRYVLDRWKSISESEIYIVCFNPDMNVSNCINLIYGIRFKPPLSSVEPNWASMIAEQRQGAQQNVTELCRSIMTPPWGVTERAEVQTTVARPSPVVTGNFKNRI